MKLPHSEGARATSTCKCQDCISEGIKGHLVGNPITARSFWSLRKSDAAGPVQEGIDYMINESGKWVFTTYYHLKKGYCCQNGCLNCPYGFKKKIT